MALKCLKRFEEQLGFERTSRFAMKGITKTWRRAIARKYGVVHPLIMAWIARHASWTSRDRTTIRRYRSEKGALDLGQFDSGQWGLYSTSAKKNLIEICSTQAKIFPPPLPTLPSSCKGGAPKGGAPKGGPRRVGAQT